MNYELAKQLQEAGFPCKYIIGELNDERTSNKYFPTLSELIEACGKFGLFSLFKKLDDSEPTEVYWLAHNWGYGTYPKLTESIGYSPEEAVARLWLSLNKKQNE